MLTTIIIVTIALFTSTANAQQVCRLTEPDILGPYYVAGAPSSQEQLCANLPAQDRLVLTGQVVDYDSQCMRGIPNVKLDLWQVIQSEKITISSILTNFSIRIGKLQWRLFCWQKCIRLVLPRYICHRC